MQTFLQGDEVYEKLFLVAAFIHISTPEHTLTLEILRTSFFLEIDLMAMSSLIIKVGLFVFLKISVQPVDHILDIFPEMSGIDMHKGIL